MGFRASICSAPFADSVAVFTLLKPQVAEEVGVLHEFVFRFGEDFLPCLSIQHSKFFQRRNQNYIALEIGVFSKPRRNQDSPVSIQATFGCRAQIIILKPNNARVEFRLFTNLLFEPKRSEEHTSEL